MEFKLNCLVKFNEQKNSTIAILSLYEKIVRLHSIIQQEKCFTVLILFSLFYCDTYMSLYILLFYFISLFSFFFSFCVFFFSTITTVSRSRSRSKVSR